MVNFSRTWLNERASGVLAHLSSLPGEYGIGNLGSGARSFVDFLAESGFQFWQICPAGPTGFGDSPYQSFSSFAGNPYFIDLSALLAEGWVTEDELRPLSTLAEERVDYGRLYLRFWEILAAAHRRFSASRKHILLHEHLASFRAREASWLEPYATFMALKAQNGGMAWNEWPVSERRFDVRQSGRIELRDAVKMHVFTQYLFFQQWSELRGYAEQRGIKIIGDIPIFVAMDSADTWQHPEVFRLDDDDRPVVCAGVPPDYFSERGQFWGNPLYDWDYLAKSGYAWWIERLRAAFRLYDVVRLDHFRGFETYWEIPASGQDARQGQWRRGPGMHLLSSVKAALPHARIIAEDLGYVSGEVVNLRLNAGMPGMKILHFGYDHDENNVNLPHFHPRESVVYTGTHDNDTSRGWLESLRGGCREKVQEYYGLDSSCSALPLVKAALSSVGRLAIIPIQDLLDLPSTARMNRPGIAEGNWQWRFTGSQLRRLSAERTDLFRRWNRLYDRDGSAKQREFSAPPEARALLEH